MAIFNGFDLRSFAEGAAIRFGRIEVGDVEIPGAERRIKGSYEIYRRGSLERIGITCIGNYAPKLFQETLIQTGFGVDVLPGEYTIKVMYDFLGPRVEVYDVTVE